MENQPNAEQPTALFVSVSGLGSYTEEGIANSGMGQITLNESLQDHGIATATFGHLQQDEIEQTIVAFEQQHPDAAIMMVGHSMGTDTAIDVANSLYENHDIEIDHLTTISTPPDALTSELVAPVGHHEDLFTTGVDYTLADDSNHFEHATNIGFDYSHTEIDNAPEVHAHIIDNVMDTVHTATCSPHEQVSDFYQQDDYQQATFEHTPHLHQIHQDFDQDVHLQSFDQDEMR
jgi:hypothetical protein